MPEMVKMHRTIDGEERVVQMPAAVVAAWAADGWRVVPATGVLAESDVAKVGKSAERELADREAAEAEAVEAAKEAAKTARAQAKENK